MTRLRRTPPLAAALLAAAALIPLLAAGAPPASAGQPAPPPAPAPAAPTPAPDEKAAPAEPPAPAPAAPPAISVSPQTLSAPGLQACGSPAAGSTQPITSSTFIPVASCSLTVPITTTVLLRGTSSLGLAAGGVDYEAYFRLGYDSAALSSTNRYVNVYASPGDGTDQSVALDALVTVAPGSHTFKLFARRYGGAGPLQLTGPAVVATVLASGSGAVACASSPLPAWQTASATLADVVTCTLNAPAAGTVQVSASASAAISPTGTLPFEAAFQLAADGADLAATRRKVDVALDSGDGSDRAVATGATLSVGPGAHTFTLRGQLLSAAGPTAFTYAPVVTALFTPSPPGPEVVCGSPDSAGWSSASASPVAVASCSLTVPVTSTVLLAASGSAGVAGGGAPYEALFTLGVDGGALAGSQRRVDVIANGGDGADAALAAGLATTVGPGSHTFTLYGQVASGAGPASLLAPHLSAAAVLPLPTVSDIADQAGLTGVPIGPIAFTVGSPRVAPEALVVAASSSDPALIPPERIVLAGSGAGRTITLTPGTAKVGSARVTVTVSDGGASSSVSFLVTVSASAVRLPLVVR